MFDLMIQQAQGVVTAGLSRCELVGVVDGAGRVIAALTSLQTRCATEIEGLGDDGVNSATVLREAGRMSTRAANTVAKTASGLTEMPKLADSLASGKITAEHAAVAVAAAAKTSAAQVEDQLSELAETSSVDVFAEKSRQWVNRNQVEDSDAHEAKRQRRSFKDWVNDDGMGVLLAELDPTSYQLVRKAINVEYERLWRDDGGRDGTPDDVRTPTQRRADAFTALITNPGARRGPGSARMQLTAVVDIERLRPDNPIGVAEIVGGEALPQTVLERMMCMATITGVVFDGAGQPVWVGRDHRHATEAQTKAIIARDRHCTGCAADAQRCEIHHIKPWEQGGRTDIDSMCLACSKCHHNIHDRGYIVIKTNTGYKIINPNNPPQGP